MEQDRELRKRLLELLKGGHAHQGFEAIVAGLRPELRGKKAAPDLPTPWQLLEHLRIAQWDILEFSRNPGHVSPEWPDGYWPVSEAPAEPEAWDESVASFRHDLADLMSMVDDGRNDLFEPFQHGQGQNLLREALLAADHNAYHLGQMVSVRRLLHAWPPA